MGFSEFLNSRRDRAKALVNILKEQFSYVSILGSDNKSTAVRVDANTSNISNGQDTECGFVVKIHDGGCFFEYSLDDISEDVASLAEEIRQLGLSGRSSIAFLIGGAFGLSEEVRQAADFRLSFSPMTFTHQMVRLLLVEQIYRAFKINRGEKYHW